MKGIDQLISMIRRRRMTFTLALLAGLIMLIAAAAALPRTYEASAIIFVDPTEEGVKEQLDTSQGDLLSRTYRALAANPNVADRVLPELDFDISRTELLDRMSFTAIDRTPLVEITARDSNPSTASAIANTYTRVFAGRVGDRFASGDVPSRVAISEPAVPPTDPSGPNLIPVFLLGSILALLGSILAAFLRDRTASGIKLGEDVDQLLNETILARIPTADGTGPTVADGIPAELADALRALRTSIELGPETDRRTLMVTSRHAGEGKTTLASYMALAAASDGDRVALVECDLRRPGLAGTALGARLTGKSPGLASYLAGHNRVDEVIQKDPALPWLNVVVAGDVPGDAGHLLRSPRLGDLIAYLREHNDWVIIDTAPVSVGDDTMLLAPLVDATIFVIDALTTKPAAAEAGLNQIRRAGGDVLGVALNRAEPMGDSYYAYASGQETELEFEPIEDDHPADALLRRSN